MDSGKLLLVLGLCTMSSVSKCFDTRLLFESEEKELNDHECEIVGTIPDWLSGTLVCTFGFIFENRLNLKFNFRAWLQPSLITCCTFYILI